VRGKGKVNLSLCLINHHGIKTALGKKYRRIQIMKLCTELFVTETKY